MLTASKKALKAFIDDTVLNAMRDRLPELKDDNGGIGTEDCATYFVVTDDLVHLRCAAHANVDALEDDSEIFDGMFAEGKHTSISFVKEGEGMVVHCNLHMNCSLKAFWVELADRKSPKQD